MENVVSEFVYENPRERVVLSAIAGGRVISWRHGSWGELVKPTDVAAGGLLRVLLGEERYPGTSFVTPHLARLRYNNHDGFAIHLRHFWNTPNAIARRLNWNHKVNPMYLDGLLLDKIVTFEADRAAFLVELSITNLTDDVRHISPWLHNQFDGWVRDAFVVMGGEKLPYLWQDFWGGHRPEPGKPMRLVHTSQDGSLCAVLGAAPDWLAGMASYTRADFGESSTEGCPELRGKTIALAARQHWTANAFLALTDGVDSWRQWATASPVSLFSRVEAAPDAPWDDALLLPLLQNWALPEEQRTGLMVLSALDKVPFTAANRYAAASSFSGFHLDATSNRATASVVLFPLCSFESVKVELSSGGDWRMGQPSLALKQHQPLTLLLDGPADLTCKDTVQVRLTSSGQMLASLRVEPDAGIEPRHTFQVKQTSTYLDERWRSDKSGFQGSTPAEFKRWQVETRQQFRKWMEDAAIRNAPLAPRLMERQVGPYCIREKILIQTEPDMWLPMYLIRPKEVRANAKLPAILFPHGSCAGKLHFAPDETADMQNPATFDQWPMPYQFAHQLGCVVLIPDRRGWGEWSEANHGQQWQRAWRAGYNIIALDMWDHLRAIDYLAQRTDVDISRIVSLGSSGGGWITMNMLAADERVAGGIVSSSLAYLPSLPEHYFFQMHEGDAVKPPAEFPLAPATMLCLAAPRPLWIMDGKWDRGVLPPLPHTTAEAGAAYGRWHAEANAGRNEAGRIYRLLDAEKQFQASWFEGDHLAGFTLNNIAPWLQQNFGIEYTK